VRSWCVDDQVKLIFLPTYGSWLNWIEAEFAALRYFALNGTDHHSHSEQNAAIEAYIRWHNARAQPNTGSPQTHRSGPRLITRPRLRDTPLKVVP
jgi:hypothetical protein